MKKINTLVLMSWLTVIVAASVLLSQKALAVPQIVWERRFPSSQIGSNWVANDAFTFSSPIPVQANGGAVDIVLGSSSTYFSGGSPNGLTPSNALLIDGDTGNLIRRFNIPANSVSVADVDKDGSPDIFFGAGGSQVECQGDGGLFSYATWGALRFFPQHFSDASQYVGPNGNRATPLASPGFTPAPTA